MSGHQRAPGPAGDPDSAVHRLDPRAKLLGLLAVTLVAVSAAPGEWLLLAACALVLAAVAAVARIPPAAVWRRGGAVLPLVLLAAAFVPFVQAGGERHAIGPLSVSAAGLATFGAVAAKAAIGTTAAVLLGATTAFPAVLRGLEALRVPPLLTLIAGLMYRYLLVVAEQARAARRALASRCFRPRHPLHAAPLGRVAGTLFVRSHARGERVHRAMLARGYSGRMPHAAPLAFGHADAAFVALVVAALLPLRLWVAVGA